jgi:YegS/Rv2252/BmrU family lipid kinase
LENITPICETEFILRRKNFMQSKPFVVFNPVAGKSNLDAVIHTLGFVLPAFNIYETTENKTQTRQAIRQAIQKGASTIVAAGGDGTVSLVADVVQGSDIPIGILPIGTGNLVARELGISLDLTEATQLLLPPHKTRRIDGMRVGEDLFVSHVSLGFYAQLAAEATAELKQKHGRRAYVQKALRLIAELPFWRFLVSVDGQSKRFWASMVMVANVGETGLPALSWGDNIQLDDDVIDICIIHARTPVDYLKLIWYGLQNEYSATQEITHLQAKRTVTIRTPRNLPIRGDGDLIGHAPLSLTVVPKAVKVLVG